MKQADRIGIIDIGSNSLRLVIYELTEQLAHRIICDSKEAARLSARVDEHQHISIHDIHYIIDTLVRFKNQCEINQTSSIHTIATAAIRNASNSQEIIEFLQEKSGLKIELLSGEEEARLGFVGTMNTLSVEHGFLIDIGGGSTELTLFKNNRIVHSTSFPFGSVSVSKRFPAIEEKQNDRYERIQRMVEAELESFPWTSLHPDLPLVGLGGTLRNVCKMNQRLTKYSLPQTHNYEMKGSQINILLERLKSLSIDQLKKVEGLSKDRTDIIIPGMIILSTIYQCIQSSHIVISGSGLRDGLFYEIISPNQPLVHNILEYSVNNLLALHSSVDLGHVQQVNQMVLKYFDQQHNQDPSSIRDRAYLHVASRLYRLGISIDYYQVHRHTYYLILHSQINGITHREKLLIALIASYKTKNRCRKLYLEHKDILSEADFQLAVKLGCLLNYVDANYPSELINSN